MPSTILVGLQWGDEGKGKITDYISRFADIVARVSGGMNASHTVSVDNKTFRFSLIPSGVLNENVQVVLTDGVVISPEKLVEEIKYLETFHNFDRERLFVGRFAPVTFRYHVFLDNSAGKDTKQNAIGTTGMGHGPTRVDQVARNGVRISEYLDWNFMQQRVQNRAGHTMTPAHLFVSEPSMLHFGGDMAYQESVEILGDLVVDTSQLLNESLDDGKHILFEVSQGAMLDLVHGFYPYVTSSSTLAGTACAGAGVGPTKIDRVIGVAKAYSTRVSKGPLITETFEKGLMHLREKGSEFVHGSESSPLRIGWLDLVSLKYAIRLNGATSMALTKLDVLSGLNEILVCVAYEKMGKQVKEIPLDILEGDYKPVYISMPGWNEQIDQVESFEGLPSQAQKYIRMIEDTVEIPISVISIGPARGQTILVNPDEVLTDYKSKKREQHESP